MPKKHEIDQLNQGSFLQPAVYEREAILPPEQQFKPIAVDNAPVTESQGEEPLAVNLLERNRSLRMAMGSLSTIAETTPVLEIEAKPALLRKFKERYPDDWSERIEEMKTKNSKAKEELRGSFNTIWGLQKVVEAGHTKDRRLVDGFRKDKNMIHQKFVKSSVSTAVDARLNRESLIRKLDRQSKAYNKAGLGNWPVKHKPQKRK